MRQSIVCNPKCFDNNIFMHTLMLCPQAMEKGDNKSFLIDGFPRNKENLDGWTRTMGGVAVRKVLFFYCEDQVIVNNWKPPF